MRERNESPFRILVVDDDEVIRDVVAMALLDAGYQVVKAANGSDAIAKAEDQWFDMAIVDVNMPKMSGIELAWRLRDSHGVPSIFMSSATDRQTVAAAISEGALGYLTKPVAPDQLIPALETALARARDFRVLSDSNHELEETVKSGHDICTAIGILMERMSVTQAGAQELLKAYAQEMANTIDQVARDIVMAQETINRVGTHDHRTTSCSGMSG